MVLPLFLMAGGAANEYKAILRSESEARARLNEARVTAEASANAKRNIKDYGNIGVELPTGLSLQGMSSVQKQRSNADMYMNWAQIPSNIAMLQGNDPNHNEVLKGDIVRSFTDSIFQPTEGDTAGVKDTYTKYDYEHLKESWPELYQELNKLNPSLLPNINLRNELDIEAAFMEADKAYDIVEGKEKIEGLDRSQYIYNVNHEEWFGKDYSKNILTSTMYGGMSEEHYQMLKSNKRAYQYTSLISTLTWRRDNESMEADEWGTELAQIKTFYNLSDKEVLDAMAKGMRKKTFDNKGNRITINNFKPMANHRLAKIADSKGGYETILKDVKLIKSLLDHGAKTGMMGKLTNVMYGVFGGDRNSSTGDIQGQIDYLVGIIDEVRTNAGGLFGVDDDEKDTMRYTIEHGSLKGKSYAALDSATSNANLIGRFEAAKENLEKLKANQGQAGYSREEGNQNVPLSSKYFQAQLETLQIYLAYKLALTEQGSGGKAVSDKDFDQALKRVGDTWWINADQAKSRLDLVSHKASQSVINEYIHTKYQKTGMSDNIQEYYQNFKGSEEKYVKSLRNYFIMRKDAKMTDRAERLLTTFSSWGETYGQKVDFNPYNPKDTAEGMGSFWALNEKLTEQEKAQVTSVENKFNEFTSIINAADGVVTEEIQNMAKGLHSMYSSKTQSSEDSIMIAMAEMLKHGTVSYEDALTSLAKEWKIPPDNTAWLSVNFIDLMKTGRFDNILGKKWQTGAGTYTKKPSHKKGGAGSIKTPNPSNPSKKRMDEYYKFIEENNFSLQ